jgi:tetratricopeptide (TPR) repeat protein
MGLLPTPAFYTELMGKAPAPNLHQQFLDLLEQTQFEQASQLLWAWIEAQPRYQEVAQWAQWLLEAPPAWRHTLDGATLTALVLGRAQWHPQLRQLLEEVPHLAHPLQTFWANLLLRELDHAEALHRLTEPPTHPLVRSLWWRCKAEALMFLELPGTEEAFAKGREGVTGTDLGRALINEGVFAQFSGDLVAARRIYWDALVLFAGDPYYQAWMHYNLGISYQNESLERTEYHMLQAEKIARKQGASAFHTYALIGLATIRERQGEWERAILIYHKVVRTAQIEHYRKASRIAIGRNLFFLGRFLEARNQFLQIQRDFFDSTIAKEVGTYLALSQLALHDTQAALDTLDSIQSKPNPLTMAPRHIITLIEVELARQHNQPTTELLAQLQQHRPILERYIWPFPHLAHLLGWSTPTADLYHVNVTAGGFIHVTVNHRPILLRPTSKLAELLVLLLEAGGTASHAFLLDRLYPNRSSLRALHDLAGRLRWQLGWAESIQNIDGSYRLDPAAQWNYLTDGGEFAQGLFSPWILEKRQQLGQV